jgi:hypothetical protein
MKLLTVQPVLAPCYQVHFTTQITPSVPYSLTPSVYHNNVTNLIHFHFHNHYTTVVTPEDGSLTPETCRGSRHNKVIVKVKVC